MLARKIKISDFRNIEQATVSFDEGVNVLYGDNAQGKTNLLEAVYYASIGKSFRGQHVGEMIRFGKKEAFLSLDFRAGEREQNLSFQLMANRVRTIEKNRVRMHRMSEIVGNFRAVLFCPEHLSLIKEGPAERRQFLNIAISTAEPLYLAALQRYLHILKQRNTLIKTAEKDMDTVKNTLEVWSAQLAKEGAVIAKYRQRYIKQSAVFAGECFAEMTASRETPALMYLGPCGANEDYEDNDKIEALLYNKLTQNTEREIYAGTTLWGVHKDDMEVTLNGKSARAYCSQGQQRSLALSLKIAEGELCRVQTGEYPVFLFDDVLSELDRGRREYLLSHIKKKQVIMTTCEKEGFSADHCIMVKNGSYEEV